MLYNNIFHKLTQITNAALFRVLLQCLQPSLALLVIKRASLQ